MEMKGKKLKSEIHTGILLNNLEMRYFVSKFLKEGQNIKLLLFEWLLKINSCEFLTILKNSKKNPRKI
jgi:hypothetical protein